MSPTANDKIEVQNINCPGRTLNVNVAKYTAMKNAFLMILPSEAPGLSQAEIQQQVVAHLADDLFPGGKTADWWAKTVQLDLEAKGKVTRSNSKPLSWHQC